MKESIGGVSLFTIVIVFIILFTGYISLSISHSKAFNVKNEIVNIIRNQGGVCTGTIANNTNNCYNFTEQITDFFKEVNYHGSGTCDDGAIGFTKDGDLAGIGDRAAFCVEGVAANSEISQFNHAVYYKIKVFWQLDLPIFNSLFNFAVEGETAVVYSPNECALNSNEYHWCNQ